MAYYIVRTWQGNQRSLIGHYGNAERKDFATEQDARERMKIGSGQREVLEFANDAEARMYCDPACVGFRIKYESERAARIAA